MSISSRTLPRWLIAAAVVALLVSIGFVSGPGHAGAQDATPTATEEATDTAENVTAADVGDADFVVGDEVQVADGPLNLRESAGTEAEVILQLATGAPVQITGGPTIADGYTWYEVQTAADDSGWVAGEFLGTEAAGFSEGDEVVVFDGPLNVRTGSGLSAGVITQLATGDTATVTGGPESADGYDWYEVEIDTDTTGWVASDFISLVDSPAGPGDAGFAIGDGVRVAVDGLNLRSGAGLDADVIDTLDLDALFLVEDGPVVADGYTWYQVFNFYYGSGWVAGELVTLEPDGFPGEDGG